MTSSCRSCGAAILWKKIEQSSRAVPLDAEPSPKGNIVVTEGTARYLKKAEAEAPAPDGELRYLSHFATCPNAVSHRKKK